MGEEGELVPLEEPLAGVLKGRLGDGLGQRCNTHRHVFITWSSRNGFEEHFVKSLKCKRGFKITLLENLIIKLKSFNFLNDINTQSDFHSFAVKFIFLSPLADIFFLVLSYNSLNFDNLFQKTRLDISEVIFLLK